MTTLRISAVLLALAAAACGPTTDTFSCNSDTANTQCNTYTISGGTWATKTCGTGQTSIASCSSAGITNRCTLTGSIAGLVTCPAGATCTTVAYYYSTDAAAVGQPVCASSGGTWGP